MSILKRVRGWWAYRRQRAREAYAESRVHATAEEQDKIKQHRHHPLSTLVTGDMPEGTGISATGTPIDFTADEKPPRY